MQRPQSRTPEEDANDFQLVGETAKDVQKREAAQTKADQVAEQRKAEAAKKETGDLFGEEKKATPTTPAADKIEDFFDTLKTETTPEGNTRLYSLKRKREISAMQSEEFSEEQKKEIRAAYDYAMNGDPVAKLTGKEFQKDDTPLTEKVTRYYAEKYNGVVSHPELGEVKLDLEGVKDSLAHGIGSIKAAAYAAVPQMIQKGKIFDRQKNWKNRGYDTVVMVAPLEIGGVPYVGEVVVEKRQNRQGFYLHEVEIKEKLVDAFKTPTEGSASPTSRLIISHLIDKIKSAEEKSATSGAEDTAKAEDNIEHSLKRQRRQVNPIREEGETKNEYQSRINQEYTVRSKAEVNRDAERLIERFGGVKGTIEAIQAGDLNPASDTAQRAVQVVLNSDEYKALNTKDRGKIADIYIKTLGTAVARALGIGGSESKRSLFVSRLECA